MVRLIGRRLLTLVPVLLLVTVITFGLIHVTPGDPAITVAGDAASQEDLARVRESLGLDRPLVTQYFTYLQDVTSLDFGRSITTQRPVNDAIAETLPITASLALLTLVLALALAIPAGVAAAVYQQRWPDRLVTSTAAVLIAAPPFVIALALVVPLAVTHSYFPATGYVALGEDPWQWFRHLILPAFALSLGPAAELVRQIRGGLIDVLEQDFIRTTRAKGLSERLVITKHAFRNAAVPVVTVFGLQVGRILGSAVVIERVSAIPGFGSLAFDAVLAHDFPLIRAVVLVSALIVIISNLAVDLSNGFLNPRLRRA